MFDNSFAKWSHPHYDSSCKGSRQSTYMGWYTMSLHSLELLFFSHSSTFSQSTSSKALCLSSIYALLCINLPIAIFKSFSQLECSRWSICSSSWNLVKNSSMIGFNAEEEFNFYLKLFRFQGLLDNYALVIFDDCLVILWHFLQQELFESIFYRYKML